MFQVEATVFPVHRRSHYGRAGKRLHIEKSNGSGPDLYHIYHIIPYLIPKLVNALNRYVMHGPNKGF